jgi:hypothetical protein
MKFFDTPMHAICGVGGYSVLIYSLIFMQTRPVWGLETSLKGLSGDLNPPAYSSLNVEVDTIQGPVTIERSVIGFINDLECM